MEQYRLGFIGCGNMASAILYGAVDAGFLDPQTTYLYDVSQEAVERAAARTGAHSVATLAQLIENSDILLMGVKPGVVPKVVEEGKAALAQKPIISIAAGWSHTKYRELLPITHILPIMPNTPVLVGEGMTLFEKENSFSEKEFTFAKSMFESIGSVEILPSDLMGVAGTVSGCGPAFVYMMIEALGDGAVKLGLPRPIAYKLASQMIAGSGKMQLVTGAHPGKLKDDVCSPGGLTIRGVKALEDGGFRSAIIQAVEDAT